MLRRDPAEVVEDRWRARAAGNWETTKRLIDPGFFFNLHVPQDAWFFAGATTGINAYLDRMAIFDTQFEQMKYRPSILGVDGDTVRGSIEYRIRHRKTGYVIDGVFRQVARVHGDRVMAVEEYHDVERIKAFMKMVSCAAVA